MRLSRNWAKATACGLIGVASGGFSAIAAPEPIVRARYLMGVRCELRAFGPESEIGPLLDAALDRIATLEQVLTTWKPDGELARLNASLIATPGCAGPGGWKALTFELSEALASALSWAGRTGGAFDPSLGALLDAWGQKSGGRVPTLGQRVAAQAQSGIRCVEFDRRRKRLCTRCPGLAFDLGGIGKGLALDAAAALLRSRGVTSALLDFGGQVFALGAPPNESGWLVDIADPRDRRRPVLTLTLRDQSASTSSNAERFFEHDGKRYGHVLDPRTGSPLPGQEQVTVIAPRATDADAASTALLVEPALRERAGALAQGMAALRLAPGANETIECWADAMAAAWIVQRDAAIRGCR